MEFFCEDVIKSCNFLFGEIILFSSRVTNEIKEEFEKSSLEVILSIFGRLVLSKDMNNGLKCMFKIKRAVVRGNEFIRNYYQL